MLIEVASVDGSGSAGGSGSVDIGTKAVIMGAVYLGMLGDKSSARFWSVIKRRLWIS